MKVQPMAPRISTGKSSAIMEIKQVLESNRASVFLLAIGSLCPVGASIFGVCPIQPSVAYVSTALLVLAAVGVGYGWPWARMFGRIVVWLNIVLFAMLVVPDWDDAVLTGSQRLHVECGVIAGYFLLCAIDLGLKRRT
jgi:hypothetical protein